MAWMNHEEMKESINDFCDDYDLKITWFSPYHAKIEKDGYILDVWTSGKYYHSGWPKSIEWNDMEELLEVFKKHE